MWLLDLFRKQKELARKLLSHEEIYSNPTEVLRRVNKERLQLQNEIAAKLQEMKDVTRDQQRFVEATQKARQETERSKRREEELQSSLRRMEADRKAIEPKQAAAKMERDKKAQEMKRLKEPVQIEPPSPESLAMVDRLEREIKALDGEMARLTEAGAKLDADMAQAQRDIGAVKANTQAQQQFADTCAKQDAEQKQKADAIAHEKADLDAAFKDTDRLRQVAGEQKLFHEVRCVINERMALAFSPLAFVLIAIPLGIMCRHGHILVGFSIGIGLLLVYYAFFMTGRVLAQGRYFYVEPSYWAADGFLSAIGLLLLMNIYKR
jgi:chromosome segregation ATPase